MKQITPIFFVGNCDSAFTDASRVRQQVFIEEQGFPYDLDELDSVSVHAVLYQNGTPVAAGRAYPEREGVYHIGRVAVIKELRGTGLGAALMMELERQLCTRGADRLVLGAQIHATGFYERLGYCPFGELFDDAGAPHQMMEKYIRSSQ